MITVKRIISTVSNSNPHLEPEAGTIAANECDTNADTCCLGKNFIVLEYTQRAADVYAYIKDIEPIVGVPIVIMNDIINNKHVQFSSVTNVHMFMGLMILLT